MRLALFVSWVWFTAVGGSSTVCAAPAAAASLADGLQEIASTIAARDGTAGPWQCVEAQGLLILSRGPASTLAAFARRVRFEAAQLAAILPPAGWLPEAGQAIPVVLYQRAVDKSRWISDPAVEAYHGYAGARVIAINTWLFEQARAPAATAPPALRSFLAAHHVARFEERRPPVPRWLQDGFAAMVRMSQHEEDALVFRRMRVGAASQAWATLEIPLQQVFTENAGLNVSDVERDPVRRARLSNESWLFVRWALLLGGEARRQALWAFGADVMTQPPAEAVLKKHFGITYAELDRTLAGVLATTGGALPEGRIAIAPEDGPLTVRDATRVETAQAHGLLVEAAELGR